MVTPEKMEHMFNHITKRAPIVFDMIITHIKAITIHTAVKLVRVAIISSNQLFQH